MSARISIHIEHDADIEHKRFEQEDTSYGSVSIEAQYPGEALTVFFRDRSDALRLLSELEALIHDRESVEMIG